MVSYIYILALILIVCLFVFVVNLSCIMVQVTQTVHGRNKLTFCSTVKPPQVLHQILGQFLYCII